MKAIYSLIILIILISGCTPGTEVSVTDVDETGSGEAPESEPVV